MDAEFNRILLVDKPKGWTSFDVVAKIRGQLQKQYNQALSVNPGLCGCDECKEEVKRRASSTNVLRVNTGASDAAGTQQVRSEGQIQSDYPRRRHKIRVGHAGTLDPMATGLLTILTGKNTSKAMEYTKLDKTYETEMTLGYESTTGDAEGELTVYGQQTEDGGLRIEDGGVETGGGELETEDRRVEIEEVTLAMVNDVVQRFIGEIEQTPPAHSAIKIKGQRAYKLAREGKKVDMPSRAVKIHDIRDVQLHGGKITFTTDVGSGTYIRSLVQDIGRALGTGAYMSALRRTKVGEFNIEDAQTVHELLGSAS